MNILTVNLVFSTIVDLPGTKVVVGGLAEAFFSNTSILADKIPCSRAKIPCSAKIIPCSVE